MARPVRLTAVVRTPERALWLAKRGAEVKQADLTSRTALRAAFDGAQVVVSNAALGSNQGDMNEMERVNRQGIENVMRAAGDAGVEHVVHVSTVAVYRTRLRHRMDEASTSYDTERRRLNLSDITTDWKYARTKTLGERLAWRLSEELGVRLTVVRPGPVYGSRDPKLTARWLASMSKRVVLAPLVGVPLVHAGDVARAITRSIDQPSASGAAFNLAGPPVTPFRALSALKRELGFGPKLIPVATPFWVAYDTSKAARELGFVSRSIEHGMREVADAYRREQRANV